MMMIPMSSVWLYRKNTSFYGHGYYGTRDLGWIKYLEDVRQSLWDWRGLMRCKEKMFFSMDRGPGCVPSQTFFDFSV